MDKDKQRIEKKHGIYLICSSMDNECCTKLCDHNVDEGNDDASISQIDAGHNDPTTAQ